jgi:hypothetical protein
MSTDTTAILVDLLYEKIEQRMKFANYATKQEMAELITNLITDQIATKVECTVGDTITKMVLDSINTDRFRKEMNTLIGDACEQAIRDYINSDGFNYIVEDNVNDNVRELIENAVSDCNVEVRVV